MGYAGGSTPRPTYQNIGNHAETIEVDYDADLISYGLLLETFWNGHDATKPAFSTQYRSAIFYRSPEERDEAEGSRARHESLVGPVQTAIEPLEHFYLAEDYHQKYRLRSVHGVTADFQEMLPDEAAFVDSTATTRVNGWLSGCGAPEQIASELPRLGLSERALTELRRLLAAHGRTVCCS